MRISILMFLFIGLLASCRKDNNQKNQGSTTEQSTPTKEVKYDKVDGVAVDMSNKGVGPIQSIILDPGVNQGLAEQGKDIYDRNCLACHKPDKRLVGPAPKGILERRAPEWIMNMILNPEGMVKEDPIAKQLLMEYNGSPMANQGLTKEEARAVLEYFRTL